jgi:hypothetical protein
MVTGSCVCGRFAFEVGGPFQRMSNCHCSFCRKLHGAAFATFTTAPGSAFRWTKGDGGQAYYESSPGSKRAFCPDCGSRLPGEPGGSVHMPAGLLDQDPGVRPDTHYFAASKAPWFEIRDGAKVYDTTSPEWEDPRLPTPPRPKLARQGTIAGSCLCGAVAWESEGVPPRMGSCHCSRCRKVRAAAFSTQVFVPHGAFRWLSGKEQVKEFFLPGAQFFGNCFCRQCGSPVPRDYAQAPLVMIPAGGLDDDPIARPMGNIYVGSKAPWYEITDGLPQFREMPPAF